MTRSSARGALLSSWLLVACVVVAGSFTSGAGAVHPPAALRSEPDRAALAIRAVDAETRRPLAVRARLVPRRLLAGSETHVAGDGRIDLAPRPGEYELIVSHGPEWSLFERTVSLAAGDAQRVEVALRRVVQAERWTACDLHVHSGHSPDADVSLATRVASLQAEDVHFAIVTDHNVITSEAVRALAAGGIGSLPGLEITTWQPEFGHFNAFPVTRVPRYRRTSESALLAELRRDPNVFVQINHPRLEDHIGYLALRERRRGGHAAGARPVPFDGLEVWNGYDLTRPERRDALFREWLALLARGQRLSATGGSDSHHLRLPYAGYPRTYVQVPRGAASDGARVLAALRAGRSFVSSGPIVELRADQATPGDTLLLRPGQTHVAVALRADGPAWMDLSQLELWLDQDRVLRMPLAAARVRSEPLQIALPVARQRSLVAVVRGERGMQALFGRASAQPYAFTNPIWLRRRD